MQRESREVEVVGKRLDGSTEPWQWWDRERVVHREEVGGGGKRGNRI